MLIRWTVLLLSLLLGLLLGLPAEAADAVFPPGSRIGLVPPAGMSLSKVFQGFEDREKNASIIFVELAGEAFPEIEKSFGVETLRAQGIDVQGREELPLKEGRGFLVIAHQSSAGAATRKWALIAIEHDLTAVISVQVPDAAQEAYPDAALRSALATFATRAAVPVQEQLDLLPFSLRDLAGFRIVRAAATGAALLTDGPKDAIELKDQPLLLITLVPIAGDQVGDHESMARRAIAATPGVKDMRIVSSESMRIGGQPGHQLMVDAKDVKHETELRVVQWLRFGRAGALRVLGAVRKMLTMPDVEGVLVHTLVDRPEYPADDHERGFGVLHSGTEPPLDPKPAFCELTRAAGHVYAPCPGGPYVRLSRPHTRLVSPRGRRIADRTPRFRFVAADRPHAAEPAARGRFRFTCRLDSRRWRRCASPFHLRRVSLGGHRLRVRATDSAGHRERPPARVRFRIVRHR